MAIDLLKQTNGFRSSLQWMGSVKVTAWWFIVLVLFVHVVSSSFFNLVYFKQEWSAPITQATAGLINGTLQAYIIQFIIIGTLFWCIGRLRFHDLALFRKKILPGIAWTVVIWGAAQIVQLIESGGDATWALGWGTHSIGNFLGQIFGNALYEEIFFRAFLISQIFVLLRIAGMRRTIPMLIIAILVSQFIFTIGHVPNRLYKGRYENWQAVWNDQLSLFISGLFLAAYFLLTNNIFIAVGIHALSNVPMPLVEGASLRDFPVPLLVVFVLLALWRRWRRRTRKMPREPAS